MNVPLVRRFAELGLADVAEVGGKNASLGEMYRKLASDGIRVPHGFATTASAYWHFLRHNSLKAAIAEALAGLDVQDVHELARVGAHIRSLIVRGAMPDDLRDAIIDAYHRLQDEYNEHPLAVAIRSSATAEDLPDASFAGQQESYLNIRGEKQVLDAVRRVYASLFTNRAISYRADMGFDHMCVALSAGVQKMVRSDLACAGVMFSIDTETGFRDAVFITGSYGLGENVVQGSVSPDEFYVFKPPLTAGRAPILSRELGDKAMKMVYSDAAGKPTKNVAVEEEARQHFCLSDEEVVTLARHAVAIEAHYSSQAGRLQPMDIEWAKDGLSGELYIVQARPETVHARRDMHHLEKFSLNERGRVLCTGKSVGDKIAAGRACVIRDISQMHRMQPGDVLVADRTDPDWEPVMKIAAAVVTNRGGRTCHAAIVARELGLPAVVGAHRATEATADRQTVTVSCAEGETGYVYEDELPFTVEHLELNNLAQPRTKIMMNVATPDQAFGFSAIPNDGVGLARLEFIINNHIGIHPNAALQWLELSDVEVRKEIGRRSAAYGDPVRFYVEKLAEGVATIAAAFYPKQVIVRMSDFKSNEYARLLGGSLFEPEEENPMLGFRGASRYYAPAFRDAFGLECQAVRMVREDRGLTNVSLMLPFTRSPEEADKALAEMQAHGLARGENGLAIYMMCELPVNVIDADAFLERFDGFSIGSNDLTQLILGVDRDSALVADIFDERRSAVLKMLHMAIEACKRHGKYVGICGQAPSDHPEIVSFLVNEGIDSISLNPDSVLATTMHVLEVEKQMGIRPRSEGGKS